MKHRFLITNRNTRILAVSVLATLLAIMLMSLVPSGALAAAEPVYPFRPSPIIDPCASCIFPGTTQTPTASAFGYTGESRGSAAPAAAADSNSLPTSTPTPCIYYENKGAQGMEAIACWTPTTDKY